MTKSRSNGRSLQYEPLEAREMLSATSLKKGVLKVKGSNHSDYISFKQTAGVITVSVSGASKSFAANQVSSILITSKKGNDVISFDSLANGGTQTLSEYTTLQTAKKGSALVHLANGHDATLLSGAKHKLVVSAWGTVAQDGHLLTWSTPSPPPSPDPPTPDPPPSPDPPATNWFDAHVIDSALRSLGHDLYSDGRIDRTDMISLLRSSEDGGIIDSTELTDLRAIVANTTLFNSLNYVDTLAGYVVSGNAANAKYQGQTLGNLTSGSSGTQMEKLVDKWFLGMDHPTAGGTYRLASGTLFVNGPSYTDIRQGTIGDCYFLSSLAETALKDPSTITNMFVVNGDGTYTVRFYNNGAPQYVTVDSYLPTSSGGQFIYADYGAAYNNASNELWTALAEKAYAQINEMGWLRPGLTGNGQNSYNALSGGYIYAALGQISGHGTAAFALTTASTSFTTFVNAYTQGKSIGFASLSAPASTQVVGGHAYAVLSYNATNQTVTLFNPWGIQYGTVTMNWSQIQQNFMYFDRTV
ncbi:MAG TPA: C2 family cysteine protease [Lacipirellulaceae bacterium]|nr:C2 family cysteine protease [Lacipirellulaceae bacterium]